MYHLPGQFIWSYPRAASFIRGTKAPCHCTPLPAPSPSLLLFSLHASWPLLVNLVFGVASYGLKALLYKIIRWTWAVLTNTNGHIWFLSSFDFIPGTINFIQCLLYPKNGHSLQFGNGETELQGIDQLSQSCAVNTGSRASC